MVLPSPADVDMQMDEVRADITLEQVVAFLTDPETPPEFIDYLLEMLSQQSAKNAPEPDPALNDALGSVTPAMPPMR